MTTTTTDIQHTPRGGFLRRMFDAILRGLEAHAHVASRRHLIEALEAKTDAELAALGIRRDQIAQHVYRDLFYS